ncbi:glycosyltransferase 61 family protein, partial [Bradyrhizobium sp. STM 3809]|uniref:glycosyltransferase 61 family protein n=1 Tax=Bradyrhizobium sp. STM 3809 TaxID=551936 RepID=UPI001F0AAA42
MLFRKLASARSNVFFLLLCGSIDRATMLAFHGSIWCRRKLAKVQTAVAGEVKEISYLGWLSLWVSVFYSKAAAASLGYYFTRMRRGPAPGLGALASRSIQICQGSRLPAIRPFFREEHARRIADGPWLSAEKLRNELAMSREVELRPLYLHEFRDAFLVDGSMYIGARARIELRSGLERRAFARNLSVLPLQPHHEFSEATLGAGVAGSTWFGHWLVDELPLQMMASKLGPIIAHMRPDHRDEPAYRKIADVEAPKRVGTAWVRRLRIIDEFAQNASKFRRYATIRSRILDGTESRRRVFVSRGNWGNPRTIANEAEIQDRLRSEGFSTLDISVASFEDIRAVLSGADLV